MIARHLLHRPLAATLLAASLLSGGCGIQTQAPTAPAASSTTVTVDDARSRELRIAIDAQQTTSTDLLALPGVEGTGAGLDASGRAEVVVLVGGGDTAVPATINGVPVEKLVIGPIRPWSLTGSYRPMPIGVSVGNAIECLPGTIGCVLVRGSKDYLLSANHVFARQNQGTIGEPIVQPSLPDLDPACGPAPPAAVIGTLADFQTVVYDSKTPNIMDAAIAEVTLPPNQVSCATPPGFYGAPSSTVETAPVGMHIMKVGRTTELTRGSVKAVNVKTKITFPSGTALFVNQVLTSQSLGDFGDSGSLVVTDDGTLRPLGIVIGGGNNGSAVVSPIGPILSRFGATICTP